MARIALYKLAHAAVTLAFLRASEVLAAGRHGVAAGGAMGVAGGLLTLTLIAALRRDMRGRNVDSGLLEYFSRALRRADRADFAGTAATWALWFLLSSSPLISGFKLAWLATAVLTAHALARPISRRYWVE